MQGRHIGILALILLGIAVGVGGVLAYQKSQSEVLIDSPVLRVETNKATGSTTVDSPFARVEKDATGTRVEAPGVDVNVPKHTSD